MAKNQKNKSISADELKGLNESQIERLLSKKGNYIQFIENPTRKQCLIVIFSMVFHLFSLALHCNLNNPVTFIFKQRIRLVDL